MIGTETRTWLAQLPKVELHLHLEGSLRPETMFTLAQRNGLNLRAASPEDLTDRYRFTGFDDFARLYLIGLQVLRTAEDFADATAALAAELSAQHVRYAEVTTTPFHHHNRGIALEEYRDGLDEGRRRALEEHGVAIGWICDIARESEPPEAGVTADFLLGANPPEGVVGLGLGGIEPDYPPELFADSFGRARSVGLASLPHAGETAGPKSVWGALRMLGADRIGHGIHSLEDPELVEHLAHHEIPLEVSPTSNVRLREAETLAVHPLGDLVAAGLRVTLNSDDPAYFQTTLTDELLVAHEWHGFTRAMLLEAQRTALAVSLADPATKARIGAELAATGQGGG